MIKGALRQDNERGNSKKYLDEKCRPSLSFFSRSTANHAKNQLYKYPLLFKLWCLSIIVSEKKNPNNLTISCEKMKALESDHDDENSSDYDTRSKI